MSTPTERIEWKLDRILELLEAKTGVQLEHTGIIRDGERVFIPGTGWTGPQDEPEDDGERGTPADARAALANTRTDPEEQT